MLKNIYTHIEYYFERMTAWATVILGNSITFILALLVVIFWLFHQQFRIQMLHEKIGDIILGITFLSLFIIQKSFNRFSASLHLKVNELVSSHEPANNSVMNLSEKTEREIVALVADYLIVEDPEENTNPEIHT